MTPNARKSANVSNTSSASSPDLVLRVAGIVSESVTDGPGLRLVVFGQGCPHGCHGCHNPETHDPDGGTLRTTDEVLKAYDRDPLLSGITLSGGEPFAQPIPMAALADAVHARGGDVICYTGYTLETLQARARTEHDIARLLDAVDLLIDGPFILEKRSLACPFRGSTNQRVIAMNETRGRLLLQKISDGF